MESEPIPKRISAARDASVEGEVVPLPGPASAPAKSHAKPDTQNSKRATKDKQVEEVREELESLAEGLACRDERSTFEDLVGANELADHPVHRWYAYKEAFSPQLPVEVVNRLGAGKSKIVADPFAGVGTTALSLQNHSKVSQVIGVEYSPFAQFVGHAKLQWPKVSADRLRTTSERLARYKTDDSPEIPGLAAFSNEEIFEPSVVNQLVSARNAIEKDSKLSKAETSLLRLGLAAIVEDVSGVSKDGRALRILRGRSRQAKALRPKQGAAIGSGVREVLTNQWLAMAEDLEALAPRRADGKTRTDRHLKGDARSLNDVQRPGLKDPPFADGSVGLCLYSPPYLNCIDYTEVYKLELWMLGFVRNQGEFKGVRLGTLRSHPSVQFPPRSYFDRISEPVVDVVKKVSSVLDDRLPRPGLGTMAQNYFEDMLKVLLEQFRILEPGGHAVCVVANSTFSRRAKTAAGWREKWRLPVLTDVLIARLAELAGFEHVEVWEARDLQPRNVRGGSARESLVVARKG